jgi:hypothetical protein
MRSVDWPQTKGVIVQSALERISGSKHVIRVYYRYEVSGKPWFSRRLKMTLSNLVDDDEVEGILHCYPKDKEVKVRYHPIFNGVAVLKPGATGLGLHLFLAILFVMLSVVSVTAIVKPGYNMIFELIGVFIG